MDIIKEVFGRNLPNFGYVIDMDNGRRCVVVLGAHATEKVCELRFREAICRRNEQMQQLYCQNNLSVDDKIELAKLMDKMFAICGARQEGLYTYEEQAAFVENLTQTEQLQLATQIQMLKDCRNFFRDYIFRV